MRLRNYADLVVFKVYADLKAEYEGNYLGWFWWIFEPVLQMAIYYVVFGIFLDSQVVNFVEFLLVGVVMWRWLSVSVTKGLLSIAQGKQLLAQTHIPKLLFPLMVLATDAVRFAIVYALLVLFLVLIGHEVSAAWVMIPLVLAVQWVFILGCTLICAGVAPFFPDIRHVTENALRAGFFLSGIFFSGASVPPTLQTYFYLNPMAVLIDAQRIILIDAQVPDAGGLWYSLIVGLALTAVGSLYIRRNEYVYPKVT